MAKRKAARATGRKKAATRGSGASRPRAGARKAGARKAASKKTARKSARPGAGAGARKAAARKSAGRKATARKTASRTGTARKATAPNAAARKGSSGTARAGTARARTTTARKASAPKAGGGRTPATTLPTRKAPNLDRARRTVREDDTLGSVPSSLDLDRSASSARSGRRELRQRFNEHTETSPQLTAGDVDADWESAYSVGDEAPGGDNPTPDQDIVDDIGRAVGVEYQDNEELKGADKVAKRDKHRWELDPASSDDYDDRD
jgi:hypothetical protein